MQYIYLHGFASSPTSAKAQYLSDRFAEVHKKIKIPDLNAGDFFHLTITRQINQIASQIGDGSTPFTLIGSSLGGLIAAHLGEKYPQIRRLVLLAPAFGFLSHWRTKLGDEQLIHWEQDKSLMVYHYGEGKDLPLCYDFVTDTARYTEEALQRHIPTLILHGRDDEVIPIQASRDFAKSRFWVELIELDSDHALSNVLPEIWRATRLFCGIP